MPLRYICQIDINFCFGLPYSIDNAFNISASEIFICDFKRHFDKNKKLVQEVNETCEISASFSLFHLYRFCLKEHAISKKYGFMVGEYLEIIFKEIKRTKRGKRESIPIFPGRMVEDLDFIPGS